METRGKSAREPRGKRAEVLKWLEREHPAELGESQWDALRRELAPVSAGYLRRLLLTWSREKGVPLAPMVEGARQDDLDALEHSLIQLLKEYEQGDAARRIEVRRRVIEAKDHARWAARAPEKRALKEEMILWMITWLENPPLFPEWVELRRRAGVPSDTHLGTHVGAEEKHAR